MHAIEKKIEILLRRGLLEKKAHFLIKKIFMNFFSTNASKIL
jgi:hypothetical protein